MVALVRVKNGTLRRHDKIKVMSVGTSWEVENLGISTPKRVRVDVLNCGEVGWVVCDIKSVHAAPVGDTTEGKASGLRRYVPG